MSNQILEEPPRTGFLRRCPRCGQWFAVEFQRSEPHEILAQIDYYRCRHCRSEMVYGKRLPPGAV